MRKQFKKLNVVVVSAHPDDICCCGGTANKYAQQGHHVVQLSVTLGETVRRPGPEQEKIKHLRKREGDAICGILGVESCYLDVPCNKIIPTMDMKMRLVNELRRLKANVILFPTPWDVHADHRNLSWTMRDVTYYAGHIGIAGDYPPCGLQAAAMYDIEIGYNEMHPPDFVVDVTSTPETNFKAIMCKERARVFGQDAGRAFRDDMQAWTRFWGMRHGVKYAEAWWYSYGSMAMMDPCRKRNMLEAAPALQRKLPADRVAF